MPEQVNGSFWTVRAVADDLGVAQNTVFGWRARGILKMEYVLGVLVVRDEAYQEFKRSKRTATYFQDLLRSGAIRIVEGGEAE